MERIIICGTRTFDNYQLLCQTLDKIITNPAKAEIVSGRAKGADILGERYAKEHNIPLVMFPAQWDLYGKSAGFKRNADMLNYAKQKNPVIIAFWDGISHGTKNMIDISRKANARVHVIQYD